MLDPCIIRGNNERFQDAVPAGYEYELKRELCMASL